MTKYLFRLSFLVLITFLSGCSYHPRDSVPRPSPRPSVEKLAPKSFVIKPVPYETSKIPEVVDRPILIVIDPGHGGDDFGTRSLSKPKYHEKSLNLTTALILKDYLQKMGYQTVMTRSEDEFIALQKRAELANDNGANLFVSVHYNSAPAKKADGVEVFYYKSAENGPRSQESSKLASSVLAQVTRLTNAKSRGVKHGNFAVIRETRMPAILIEGGFLTNEEEMEKIKDPMYVKKIAWGIAQGIRDYFNMNK